MRTSRSSPKSQKIMYAKYMAYTATVRVLDETSLEACLFITVSMYSTVCVTWTGGCRVHTEFNVLKLTPSGGVSTIFRIPPYLL